MKHRMTKLITLLILLPTLLLSACDKTQQPSGQNTPSPSSPEVVATASPSEYRSPSPPPSPAPTDWHSGVKTDYSKLTTYQPLQEKYTRLSKETMQELKPSTNYGKLLPYVGETLYGTGGYNAFSVYGLTTDGAVIVTDPIYAHVYQGSYYDYGTLKNNYVPAYDLEKLTDKIDKSNLQDNVRHAVCALDGSWVTKFDYMSTHFADKVFIGVRDYGNNDADIYDYSGKLLYNTKSLGCYRDIPPQSGYSFDSGYGDGLIGIPLSTGKTVYIDALTGAETYTDFKQGEAFFGGFARVTENGLVGFIDKNFKLVIKPQFLSADFFKAGRDVVQLPDKSYAVIDGSGKILFKSMNVISRWDNNTYSVNNADNSVQYYSSDFTEITAGAMPLIPLYNGWFYYKTDTGTVLLNGKEKYRFDGNIDINSVTAGFVSYYVSEKDNWSQGLKTMSGKDIIPLTKNENITVVTGEKADDVFIITSQYTSSSIDQTFSIMTKEGKTILSGKGYASYNDQFNLFELNDEQSYGYLNLNGSYVFRISLLQYMPD